MQVYTSFLCVCARAMLVSEVSEEETGMSGRVATQACEDVVA